MRLTVEIEDGAPPLVSPSQIEVAIEQVLFPYDFRPLRPRAGSRVRVTIEER